MDIIEMIEDYKYISETIHGIYVIHNLQPHLGIHSIIDCVQYKMEILNIINAYWYQYIKEKTEPIQQRRCHLTLILHQSTPQPENTSMQLESHRY